MYGAGGGVGKYHVKTTTTVGQKRTGQLSRFWTDATCKVKAHVTGPARDDGTSGLGNPLLYPFKTRKEGRHKDSSDAPRPKEVKAVRNVDVVG